jgi:microcystin-dependent protein
MAFTQQVITDVGKTYLRNAQTGSLFNLTKLVVGKGIAVNIPGDLYPLTGLISYVMDVPIISWQWIGTDTVQVTGTLSSLNVPAGGQFNLNEIGVIAKSSDLSELLYSVANTGGGGDLIPDKNNPAIVLQTVQITIKIDRVSSVTINVLPIGDTQGANKGLTTVGPGPFIDKEGDTLYFKRYVASPSIIIQDQGDTLAFDVSLTNLVPAGVVWDFAGTVLPVGWLACDGSLQNRVTYAHLFNAIGTKFGAGDGINTFGLPDFRGKGSIGVGQGTGQTNRNLGDSGGTETVVLTTTQIPSHTHTASQPNHSHTVSDPTHAHSLADPSHTHTAGLTQHTQKALNDLNNWNTAGNFYTIYGQIPTHNRAYSRGATAENPDFFGVLDIFNGVVVNGAYTGMGVYGAGTGISLVANGAAITVAAAGGGAAHSNMPPFLTVNKMIKT